MHSLRPAPRVGLAVALIVATTVGAAPKKEDETRLAADALAHLQSKGFIVSFQDLDGKIVSLADERFKDKVVLVEFWGTWCPQCRRTTPTLNQLYEKYKGQGFEIVGVAFEKGTDHAANKEAVRAYATKSNVTYTNLYAGFLDDFWTTLPEPITKLGSPILVFVGRDGKPAAIESGFWDDTPDRVEAQTRTLLERQ